MRGPKAEGRGSKFRTLQPSRAAGQAPPKTAEPVPCEPVCLVSLVCFVYLVWYQPDALIDLVL